MAQGGDKLIKIWINARATDELYPRFRLVWISDTFVDFLVRLTDKLYTGLVSKCSPSGIFAY